jgi:hypothetical protein
LNDELEVLIALVHAEQKQAENKNNNCGDAEVKKNEADFLTRSQAC